MNRRAVRPLRLGVAAVVLALVGVLCSTPAASATPGDIPLTPQTQTIVYGSGWDIQGQYYASECSGHCSAASLYVTVDGVTKDLGTNHVYGETLFAHDSDFHPPKDFGVGTHTISFRLQYGSTVYGQSATPAKVIVTAAAITSTTTIAVDPINKSNAVVTSQLSGAFIDSLPNCYCEAQGTYPLPAGTWNLSITDSTGKTVFSRDSAQAAGGEPYLVSYWQNVPAGKSLTAQSTYTITGPTKSNFTMKSPTFAWTSNPSSNPKPVKPKGKAPLESSKTATALPLIVYLAALTITVIIVVLDVLLLLRRRRRRRGKPAAPSGVAEGAGV
jgi:hypothetical protein